MAIVLNYVDQNTTTITVILRHAEGSGSGRKQEGLLKPTYSSMGPGCFAMLSMTELGVNGVLKDSRIKVIWNKYATTITVILRLAEGSGSGRKQEDLQHPSHSSIGPGSFTMLSIKKATINQQKRLIPSAPH